MRRATWALVLVLAAACSGEPVSSPTATTPPASVPPSTSPSESSSPSPGVEPVNVPNGTPPSFDEDVDSSDVPPEALIPPGTSATDVWYAETSAGSTIMVAFVDPGTDPFRLEHGLLVWRRFPGEPQPWRPVFGLLDPPERGVVELHVVIGDATGDGSPDALTFENTGGSGVCGTWRVIDLAANAAVSTKKTCDTTIDLSTDPPGLVVREAVFADGDAHCCPSSTRTSVLTYDAATGWTVDSTTEQPT
jgi:hypothetical protein